MHIVHNQCASQFPNTYHERGERGRACKHDYHSPQVRINRAWYVHCPLPYIIAWTWHGVYCLANILPVTVFHNPGFEQSDVLNISNVWVLLPPPPPPLQSPKGSCLVTPRRRLPSAADEEWYSPKRVSNTAVESNSSRTTQR